MRRLVIVGPHVDEPPVQPVPGHLAVGSTRLTGQLICAAAELQPMVCEMGNKARTVYVLVGEWLRRVLCRNMDTSMNTS